MRRRFTSSKGYKPENYLTIIMQEDGYVAYTESSFYCINGGNWELSYGHSIPVKKGDVISYKSISTRTGQFRLYNKCEITGTIMSLFYGDNAKNKLSMEGLNAGGLFYNCSGIVSVSKSILPATTLANYCYYGMFSGCTSLTTVPELPATTLANYCYSYMFSDCTSLTSAPELPATTLADECYSYMFSDCSKLNYIKMLATDISAIQCLYAWVLGVASTGTFVKNPEATWDKVGNSGVPEGWIVKFDGEE